MYFLLYLPLTTNIAAEKSLGINYNNEIIDLKQSPSGYNNLENPEMILPKDIGSEQTLNWLDKVAVDKKLRLLQISQDKPTKNDELEQQDIRVVVEGSQEALTAFIAEVEKSPRHMKLLGWEVLPQEETLQVTLKIATFALP